MSASDDDVFAAMERAAKEARKRPAPPPPPTLDYRGPVRAAPLADEFPAGRFQRRMSALLGTVGTCLWVGTLLIVLGIFGALSGLSFTLSMPPAVSPLGMAVLVNGLMLFGVGVALRLLGHAGAAIGWMAYGVRSEQERQIDEEQSPRP